MWYPAGHDAADGALTGEHTRPSPAAGQVAQAEEGKAKQGREAQQEELVKRTGDSLYPPSGFHRLLDVTTCLYARGTIAYMLRYMLLEGLNSHLLTWHACMYGCPCTTVF